VSASGRFLPAFICRGRGRGRRNGLQKTEYLGQMVGKFLRAGGGWGSCRESTPPISGRLGQWAYMVGALWSIGGGRPGGGLAPSMGEMWFPCCEKTTAGPNQLPSAGVWHNGRNRGRVKRGASAFQSNAPFGARGGGGGGAGNFSGDFKGVRHINCVVLLAKPTVYQTRGKGKSIFAERCSHPPAKPRRPYGEQEVRRDGAGPRGGSSRSWPHGGNQLGRWGKWRWKSVQTKNPVKTSFSPWTRFCPGRQPDESRGAPGVFGNLIREWGLSPLGRFWRQPGDGGSARTSCHYAKGLEKSPGGGPTLGDFQAVFY